MTPLLFPYTILSPEMVALAARFLPSLTVYQPISGLVPEELQPWVDRGFLNFSIPVPDGEATVASAADEYQLWARQYQPGKDLKAIRPVGGTLRPPFFDESATSQILTELKNDAPPTDDSAPPLFSARLFLCLAQNLDQHQYEVRRQLDRVEAESNALIDELKPADGLDTISKQGVLGVSPEDVSDFMLSERLAAWGKLFFTDQTDNAFLVTTSLPVFTDFITSCDAARFLMRINSESWKETEDESEPDRQRSLLTEVNDAAARSLDGLPQPDGPFPDSTDENAELTIYVIPDRSLREYLAEVVDVPCSDQIHPQPADDRIRNIVIGFLDAGRLKPE